MSRSFSFSTNDDQLIEWLDEKENKSAFIEAAVRWRMNREGPRPDGGSIEELTSSQAEAHGWMLDRLGDGGMIGLEKAKNRIAQKTNQSEDLVMADIIKPLERKGRVTVITGVSSVRLQVNELGVTA